MRATIATVLATLLAGLLFQRGPATDASMPLLALAAMSLYLELIAVGQRGFGFFSCSFASLFAMVLTPSIGGRWALGATLLGMSLRTASKGNPRPQVRWREALADLFPVLAALLAATLVSSPLAGAAAGLAVYLPLSLWLPEWLAEESPGVELQLWFHLREMTGYHCFAVGFAGPVLAYLVERGPYNCLWLLPLFFALHRAARTDLLRLEEIEKELLRERERRSQRALQETSQRLQQTSQQLRMETEGRGFLEDVTRRLARCLQARDVLEVLLAGVSETIPCQSVVFFGTGLTPVMWRSPWHERLETAPLHKRGEPIVEQSWAEGRPVFHQGSSAADRLLENEQVAVALPMEGQGVFYVGRLEPLPYTPRELDQLATLASQGALALQSVGRYQETQEALKLYQGAHARLTQAVARLSYLLDSSRALSAPLEVDALLDRFRQIVESLLPGQTGVLVFAGEVRMTWGEGEGGADVMALHQAVSGAGRPLILDDISRSRFCSPGPSRSSLAVPLLDEDGSWGSVLLFSVELAAFQREDQELLELVASQLVTALRRTELNARIRQSQGQLAQSSKMAAVGQLAAGIAHELNTPLGAAVLQIDSALMRLRSRPELVPEKLEVALQAICQVQNIVSKLLIYSREGSAGRKLLDLNSVVQDTLLLIERQIEVDGVKVECRLQPLPQILGNPTEMQQVLTNLLLNARDATLQGGAREVVVESGVAGGEVYVQVMDRGPGVAPEDRVRIFEPFFTTKSVGHGTGLGLSVSQEIVQSHGGRLELLPGAETVFRMTLPQAG